MKGRSKKQKTSSKDDLPTSIHSLYGEPLLSTPQQTYTSPSQQEQHPPQQINTSHNPSNHNSSNHHTDAVPISPSRHPLPRLRSPNHLPQISVEASVSDGTDETTGQAEGAESDYSANEDDEDGKRAQHQPSPLYPARNIRLQARFDNKRDSVDTEDGEQVPGELPWGSLTVESLDQNTSDEPDAILQSWSKELSQMSSFYPELINAPSSLTLRQGLGIVSRLSGTSMMYTIFASLPSFLALVCLLLSNRPNAIHETAAFALGASISSLLWGMGLSLGGGMDLKSTEAVIDETWHVCWKLLTKCSCVAFWFFIIISTPLFLLERFAGFPTSLFNTLLGEDVGQITTSTINIYSIGYLANYFFEAFHRFLSYQARSDSQVVLVFAGSLLHCILLVSIVWRAGQGPEAAALLYSSIACVRAFSLAFYVYLKKYELGWQSGVRVRLFQRERQSFGRGGRRGLSTSSRPSAEGGGSPEPQRRQRRVATRRPGQLPPDIINALQSSGSLEAERSRSDSLHPITAVVYAAEKETEKLERLEKEAESWFQIPPVTLQGGALATKTTVLTLPPTEKSDVVLATFAVPTTPVVSDDSTQKEEPRRSSLSRSRLGPVLGTPGGVSQYNLQVDQTPESRTARGGDHNISNHEQEVDCNGAPGQGAERKSSSFKSPVKRDSLQKARRKGGVGFQDVSTAQSAGVASSPQVSSLFQARRLSKKLASGLVDQSQISSPLEKQSPSQYSEAAEGVAEGDSDEAMQQRKKAAGRRKRIRQKTVVSVRSVSVDNYLVLDGWCLPTSWSWRTYWKVQNPRQLRETKEFLRTALPSAFILSMEFLSFDLLVVIASLLGPPALAVFSLIISLNTLLDTFPLAISSCISDQIHFLVRLDNIPSARTLVQMTAKLILCVSGFFSCTLIIAGLYYESIFNRHSNELYYQSLHGLPISLIILALISTADSFAILLTASLRGAGLLLSSVLSVGIILALLMPILMLTGILLFGFSIIGCLLIVLGCILLLCVVAFVQLVVESLLFAEEPTGGLPQREIHLPYLSLKTFRRGPVECRPLFPPPSQTTPSSTTSSPYTPARNGSLFGRVEGFADERDS